MSVLVARDGGARPAFTDAMEVLCARRSRLVGFPAWDCLPYDRAGPSAGRWPARRSADAHSPGAGCGGEEDLPLLVTTAPAFLQRVPPRKAVTRAGYAAAVGASVDIADLEGYFAVNGYHRASTVSERGEFAVRGGVIDVFPPGAAEPVRLDLFGDTLESIRAFDRETQRSTRQLKAVDLLPVSEALLDAPAIARFRTGYLAAFGAPGDDPLYATVSEGGRRAGMEHWLSRFFTGASKTLFDYLPASALIGVDHLAREARDERLAMIADAFEAREQADRKSHYRALPPGALYLSAEEWDERLREQPARQFTPFAHEAGDAAIDMGGQGSGGPFAAERAQDSVNLFEAAAQHVRALSVAGKRVLFASWSEGSSERLGVMLADRYGLEVAAAGPLLAGGQGGGSKEAPARRAAARRRLRDRRPGGHLRNRHPGRPPGQAAPPPARRQLSGRGFRPYARRSGGPRRPRHRPLSQGLEVVPRRSCRPRTFAWSSTTPPIQSFTYRWKT